MSQQKKKLLPIILPIILIAIAASIVLILFLNKESPPDQSSDHIHEFSEWEVVVNSTCTQEGKKAHHCLECQTVEEEILPLISHQYTDIKNSWQNNTNYIESICAMCGLSTGDAIEGGYSAETNTIYLYNCASDFSFDIVCSNDEDYIRNNLTIVESMFSDNTGDMLVAFSDEYTLSKVNENIWRVSPIKPYLEKTGYDVLLGDNISIANFPEKQLSFRTQGEESDVAVFNDDILFLKQFEEQNPGYYPYDIEFDSENAIMMLTVSQQGVFAEDMIGKILCVGECTDMEVALSLPSDQVNIGRIESINRIDEKIVITLGPIGFEDIYSEIDVTLGDKQPIIIEDFTEEEKNEYASGILKNQAFRSIAATAMRTAENYAFEIGGTRVEADWEGFIADLLGSLGISKKDEVTNNPNDYKVKIGIGTVRGDGGASLSIKIKRNGTTIAKVKLSIVIKKEIIITMDGNVTKNNIKEYIGDQFNFFNDDDVIAYFYTEFIETDITTFQAGVNLSFELDSETVYYVVSPKSNKIHTCSCVYASGYNSDDDVYYTFADIKEKFGSSYKEQQCKKCIPFSDSKFFGVNKDTGVVHCMGGSCVENMDLSKIYQCVFLPQEGAEFSGGIKYKYCTQCKPLEKAENSEAGVAYSFDDYIQDGFKEGNWDTEFKFLSKFAFEKFGIDDSRDIDFDKTKAIAHWGVVELRLGVYPIVDIKAQVSADLNYIDVVKKKYVIEIQHNPKTNKTQKNIHAETVELSTEEKGIAEFTVDIDGSIEAKIGVRGVVAVGVIGVGKWFNINLSADVGVFVDVNGMIHLNLRDEEKNENFNCGYGQIGLFIEVSAGGTVAGEQFKIGKSIVDEKIPFISIGDSTIYYGYCDYEQELDLKDKDTHKIDSSLLNAVIYDLEQQEKKFAKLNPTGAKGEYSVKYKFTDDDGNEIKYCSVKDGILYVDSSAPSTFEINMIVIVIDDNTVDWSDVFDSGIGDKLGTSYSLPELTIRVIYESIPTPTAEKTEIAPATHPSGIYLTDEEVTFNITANLESTYGMALFCNDSQVDIAYADEMVLKDGKQTVSLHATFGGAGTHTIEARPLNQDGVPIKSAKKEAIVQITIHDKNLCTAPQITTASNQSLLIDHPFKIEWKRSPYPIDGITYSITVDYRGSDPWEYPLAGEPVDGTSYIIDASVFSKPGRYGITVYPVSTDPAITVPEGCYSVIGIDVVETCVVHTPITIPAVSATCTSNGLTEGTKCSTCDGIMSPQEETPLIPHNYINDQCTVCGKIRGISQGLTYVLNEKGTAYIVKGIGTCTDAEIIIPSTYQNLPVVGIADISFIDNEDIISIIIPDSITYIGNQAFKNCTSLILIEVGSKLDTIGYDAFYQCTSLKELYIPANVKSIGDEAFYGCKKLTVVEIGDRSAQSTFTTIGQEAFEECVNLRSVYIGNGVSAIRQGAFSGCSSLESVEFGNSIASIGDNAFKNCSSLTEISIPKSIGKIGFRAFYSCSALKNIEFGGTTRMWKNVSKGNAWCDGSPVTTVKCSDGDADI